jgi:ribosomal protein S13
VFRNLLQIKGISTATATKMCFLLGISCNTIYSKLSTHKIDQLNLLLSIYKKKTSPFYFNALIHDVNSLFALRATPTPVLPIGSQGGDLTRGGKSHLSNVFDPSLENKDLDAGLAPRVPMGQRILHSPILTSLDDFKKENLKILITLNTYRGRRFKYGYPVKGQRTRSNGRTARRLNRIKL